MLTSKSLKIEAAVKPIPATHSPAQAAPNMPEKEQDAAKYRVITPSYFETLLLFRRLFGLLCACLYAVHPSRRWQSCHIPKPYPSHRWRQEERHDQMGTSESD